MIAKIVVLPGDGIGPEVIASATEVLRKAARLGNIGLEMQEGWIGGASLDHCGKPLEMNTLMACKAADAVLLGAVGGPKWEHLPGNLRPEAGLLQLRKELEVFANIRPVKARPALAGLCPYRPEILDGVDLVIVRELTGGLYFGDKASTAESAYDVCAYTAEEIRRITRVAARLARSRKQRLASIDKANVLETSRLWRKTVNEVMQREFADVKVEHILVDAAAMYLAQRPASFDVIVTENMFGDILSDQSSTLAGSLGLLPSASIGSNGSGLYEPVHGSAPDIAGRGIANPIGTILSVAMLIRHSLKKPDLADRVERAVEGTISDMRLTPDLTPNSPYLTRDITKQVCDRLQ